MAVELFTDRDSPRLNTSPPRISFSSDLSNSQTQIIDQTADLSDFSFHSQPINDFHFSFSSSSSSAAATAINDPSPADELFTGGIIRPLHHHQQQQQLPEYYKPLLLSDSLPHTTTDRFIPKKPIEAENPETDQPIKPTVKSIWGIKRSNSLHCEESSHKKCSSFWSLPLLARSNSTGSKETQTQTQKQKQIQNSSSSSSSCNSSFSMYNFSQKPPLKKNYGNGIGIGIGIVNPVLNVPSPLYLSKSKGSFGFSSLFRNNGKERKNKK